MFAHKFGRELFFVVILLFSLPLISLAGGGDGGTGNDAAGLGYPSSGPGVGPSAYGGGTGNTDQGNSFGFEFSGAFSTALSTLPPQYPEFEDDPAAAVDKSRFGYDLSPGSASGRNPNYSGNPSAPSAPSDPGVGNPSGPSDPGAGPGRGDNPGGPGLESPGGGPSAPSDPGGGNPGTGNPGGGLGGGNPGGGLGGGNPGGGNPGGPSYGDNDNSNPDNNWYNAVTNLAQGLQSAFSVTNPAFTLVNNAIQFGTNTVLNDPTVPRNIPRYTNFSDLTQINSSTTIRLIARADRTDDWQIEEAVDPNVASSSVRLLTTREEMDAWYTGKSEGANSIVFEAKVVGSDGRVIVNWVTIPFGALNIPKAAQLYLRWNADSYTQCLAFLNDNGRYTFQTKDRSMKRGDTESEQYDIPEVTGIYSIQCARQTNAGTIVDQKNIQVIVGS